jgi:hypothetical protein
MSTRHSDRAVRRAEERARQRAERRRRTEVSEQRKRRFRRVLRWTGRSLAVGGAAAVVVVAIVLAVGAVRDALAPGPGSLPPITPAHAYKIDYRIVFQPGNVVRQEEDVVERPFHSIQLSRTDTGKLNTGELTNDQGLFFYHDPKGWTLIDPDPQRAANDPDPAAALTMALKHGIARVLKTDTLLGRPCSLVRVGSPLGQPLTKGPTGSNHVDLCLDRTGVILSYAWTLNGKLAQSMTATSFDPDPTITATTFAPQPGPVSASAPVKGVPLSEGSRAKLTPRFQPPPGLVYHGGWVRVETLGQSFQVTTSLLYLRGSDELIQIDYSSGGSTHPGTAFSLSGGHTAYLQLQLDHSTVYVPEGQDATITITGTDIALLTDVARRLQF